MESPIYFELSYDSRLWGNDSRIEDIKRCLSLLSSSYKNINRITDGNLSFHLQSISRSTTAEKSLLIPQIALHNYRMMEICLRHKKQIAIISVANDIDISILQTAIFYYMEYYTLKYQILREKESMLLEERNQLKSQIMAVNKEVDILQQRDILEDDHILLEALDRLHNLEEKYKTNGHDFFEMNQSTGRLFRFQEV